MRSRWFHKPTLHTADSGVEKRASWLELFYDLIFVAAFIQLGNGLSKHVTLVGFASFAALFVPLWVSWVGQTFFFNRYTVDDFFHRVIVFLQMFSVGAMAITAPRVLDGHPKAFAIAYASAQFLIGIQYWRACVQVPEAKAFGRYWSIVFFIGAAFWAASCLFDEPACYVFWGLGIVEILIAPVRKYSRNLEQSSPADREHLSERFGLLTMIVLGESFVKVLGELSGTMEASAILQACMTLTLTCSIWWIYFDDVAGSELRGKRFTPIIWLYSHLPLQLGVTASGVAIKKAVLFDLHQPAGDAYRWLLCSTLALVFIAVSVIDSVSERREAELSDSMRVNMRFVSGLALLLIAPTSGDMSAAWFLTIVTAICIAQVVFDMVMAPLQESEDTHRTVAELVRDEQHEQIEKGKRHDVADAIRKGTPSDLRRDLYFFLMEGSWKRFFFIAGFVFILVNLMFAALYMLEPGSIDGARGDSFADAFYFSVQTLTTIGYGVMSPESDYGNIVVTVESAFGLLYVALATGITFARASRPRGSVLFSDKVVVSKMDGAPTLMVRAGNARGNDVVDASVSLTILKDEITPEGIHMRRLYELELHRERSPLFSLTWSIMHTIDEDSPLFDTNWHKLDSGFFAMIVTLVGHDGTYGQTVYARHIYYPEDFRVDHKYADVIGHMPDGRFVVDYHKFHDTEPLADDAPTMLP